MVDEEEPGNNTDLRRFQKSNAQLPTAATTFDELMRLGAVIKCV